jgi:hypothetical protein
MKPSAKPNFKKYILKNVNTGLKSISARPAFFPALNISFAERVV